MALHYRTQGLIIKKIDRGEADQFLTIYTRDFGKLKILGKAVRKIKSKLRGGADLFYLSEIEFIQGKAQKTLTDAALINGFFNIRKDLKKLSTAYRVVNLLDELVPAEQKDEELWQLIVEVFQKLNSSAPDNRFSLLYYYFFWNLVCLLGYEPELGAGTIYGKKIEANVVKTLKMIMAREWQNLSNIKIEDSHLESLKGVSKWYKINI